MLSLAFRPTLRAPAARVDRKTEWPLGRSRAGTWNASLVRTGTDLRKQSFQGRRTTCGAACTGDAGTLVSSCCPHTSPSRTHRPRLEMPAQHSAGLSGGAPVRSLADSEPRQVA